MTFEKFIEIESIKNPEVKRDWEKARASFERVLQENGITTLIREPKLAKFIHDVKSTREVKDDFNDVKIKNIYYNDERGKESVVVIWEDGVKIVKKLAEGDSFDLNVGVALCIAERMFGSKNAFHKEIKTKAKKTNKDK